MGLSLNQSHPKLPSLLPSVTGQEQPWEAWPPVKVERVVKAQQTTAAGSLVNAAGLFG